MHAVCQCGLRLGDVDQPSGVFAENAALYQVVHSLATDAKQAG
jgi:hypothetical protein